ncbi:hypothetical protein BVC80_9035g7 [Macleaya cordata]|uniref:Uncharacterized protein n=1 Tax=Macleaya cordata TaxID=56857 RepID=A0A200QYC5_MACCD|nr:hypothetical protein BVC80_9035g7 [Macleaya cordata]
MDSGCQTVGSDIPDENSGYMGGLNRNDLVLRPVAAGESGEGLPYAPINWPNPGDNWRWKAGNRKTNAGFMQDRYLYPPRRLRKTGKQHFASRLSVQEYIKKEFPNADVDAFFASFSWRIPSKDHDLAKIDGTTISSIHIKKEMAEHSGSGSKFGTVSCKAGNERCSLQQARKHSLQAIDCDICCSESGFCRDCCCILCCKTIDSGYGGYSFIRCQEKVNEYEDYICGHVAHLDCALRSYMAGVVGGSVGLDAEYYCRRCDKRTDLIPHVELLLRTCESLDSKEDIEKILNMGLCILRGSQKERAKKMLNRTNMVLAKLKKGSSLDEIWNVEDNISEFSAGNLEGANNQDPMDFTTHNENNDIQRRSQEPVYITSDHRIESSKLEDEIDKVLSDLRKSQEEEYRIAEGKLKGQKDFLLGLYQQLETERSELARPTSSTTDHGVNNLLSGVLSRVNQIKAEVLKLKTMEEVAKGFGQQYILAVFFVKHLHGNYR